MFSTGNVREIILIHLYGKPYFHSCSELCPCPVLNMFKTTQWIHIPCNKNELQG